MPHTTARTTEPPRKSGSRWTWVAVWLLLAGVLGLWGLGGSHTGRATPVNPAAVNQATMQSAEPALRTKPIEQVQLGERLSGRNPLREEVDLGEPDPATWRRVELRLMSPGGERAEIEFLWPPKYLEATGATVGGWVELDMPEVGAVGQAEVVSIGPCPPIPPGTGPIVTGRFVHQSDGPALNIHVEGLAEPIGCTANHPFWSEDRQQFVEAGPLRPGEHVRTQSAGVVPITCITPRPSAPLVYNLQVHGEHVYEVSELGVLVHNKHGVPKRVGRAPSGTAPKTVPRSPKGVADVDDFIVPGHKWYHGTDADSADNIIRNGVDRKKLLGSDPVEGADTPGLFVTDKLSDAEDYARLRGGERGKPGSILEWDDTEIGRFFEGVGEDNEAVIPFDMFDNVPRPRRPGR
ncbi:MAG: hypothetical protein U1E05_01785 [Patescibacteria group bacterium]|nr:hypothetical protein [Patescibacteria group bacterium]